MLVQNASIEDITVLLSLFKDSVSFLSGGHNPTGIALNDITVDMASRRYVYASSVGNLSTLRIGGGTLWGDVYSEIDGQPFDVVGGGASTVGVVGNLLCGGISWISRHRGLASASVLGYTLVTPTGEQINVSLSQNPDVFASLTNSCGSLSHAVLEVELRLWRSDGRMVLRLRSPSIGGARWIATTYTHLVKSTQHERRISCAAEVASTAWGIDVVYSGLDVYSTLSRLNVARGAFLAFGNSTALVWRGGTHWAKLKSLPFDEWFIQANAATLVADDGITTILTSVPIVWRSAFTMISMDHTLRYVTRLDYSSYAQTHCQIQLEQLGGKLDDVNGNWNHSGAECLVSFICFGGYAMGNDWVRSALQHVERHDVQPYAGYG